jgi:hypothetical protein
MKIMWSVNNAPAYFFEAEELGSKVVYQNDGLLAGACN